MHLTSGLELLHSLDNPLTLLALLEQGLTPDLLLLDIEMPQLSGLELVRLLPSPAPEVVLVTSHAHFAVDAFALPIADYLLKPLEYARFLQALARVRERRTRKAEPVHAEAPYTDSQHVFIKTNGRLIRLDFSLVLYIEAMSSYSTLVTATRKHIVHATMKVLEERLPAAYFLRVHRSYMVNTNNIDSIANGAIQLGAYEVPIGTNYEPGLMARLRSL